MRRLVCTLHLLKYLHLCGGDYFFALSDSLRFSVSALSYYQAVCLSAILSICPPCMRLSCWHLTVCRVVGLAVSLPVGMCFVCLCVAQRREATRHVDLSTRRLGHSPDSTPTHPRPIPCSTLAKTDFWTGWLRWVPHRARERRTTGKKPAPERPPRGVTRQSGACSGPSRARDANGHPCAPLSSVVGRWLLYLFASG